MGRKSKRFISRELSWLEFNQRVLDEAQDESNPLLERLKFVAITASNLDEFFMVRVGSLNMMVEQGVTSPDPSGLTPAEQMTAIRERCQKMVKDQYEILLEQLEPALKEEGIIRQRQEELTEKQYQVLKKVIEEEVFSILTPMVIQADEEFPLLINQSLNTCTLVENADKERRFVVVPFARSNLRFITLPSESGYQYILLEDALALFMPQLFPGETVLETVPFRITRNADFELREDSAADLMVGMKEILDARKEGTCIRLETSSSISAEMLQFLCEGLEIDRQGVYAVPGPVDLAAFFKMANLGGYDQLKYKSWPPLREASLDPRKPLFQEIAERDILLSHPYESYDPVVRFLEEAAVDPDVLAIKQTLYRTSSHSAIIAALKTAAEQGKHVTALVELKARFDEARNIKWASELEQVGIQVIYGVKGLKTHAKICLVVRREPSGIRRYVHFGTGNYNESTAKLYSDISLMTCNPDLGADASNFFNAISGYSQPMRFSKLEVAPIGLRDKILELIHVETDRKKHGQKARITIKMNSLVDTEIIEALYQASEAGVKIRLNIRGICCLKPGVKGLSENISVVSIIDRFLEHSRILHFYHGGDERVYISSADWMPRNLDRRVELLVPVDDVRCKAKLINTLNMYFKDTVKSRKLQPNESYKRIDRGDRKQLRVQEYLYEQAKNDLEEAERSQRLVFEPHLAAEN
ncbi:MAG: polyphosphate kinase 1 [Planctomycetaceae bacterium]|nr:polyphosphate kinase 1 [Planctomycetaceae bacterium]